MSQVIKMTLREANADHWVVFEVWIDDTAWPLIEPPVT